VITLRFGPLQFSVYAFGFAIGCLHRYWRGHPPSLARFADAFDEASPRVSKLRDLVFEGRAIALDLVFFN
jgi:hypothetical protein